MCLILEMLLRYCHSDAWDSSHTVSIHVSVNAYHSSLNYRWFIWYIKHDAFCQEYKRKNVWWNKRWRVIGWWWCLVDRMNKYGRFKSSSAVISWTMLSSTLWFQKEKRRAVDVYSPPSLWPKLLVSFDDSHGLGFTHTSLSFTIDKDPITDYGLLCIFGYDLSRHSSRILYKRYSPNNSTKLFIVSHCTCWSFNVFFFWYS